jgi:ribosomal protein S8
MKNNLIKFLIKLKNASIVKKEIIIVNYNRNIVELLFILYKEGLIHSYSINLKNLTIKVYFKYNQNKDLFRNFKIISKISSTIYLNYNDICRISQKGVLLIFSTSKGFLTGLDCKKYRFGGKLLFSC